MEFPVLFQKLESQLELGNHQIFKCADLSLVQTLSFYDNRVFGQFSKFVGVVTEVLSDLDAPFSVCSIEHLFWEHESFKSTFFEHSPAQKEALNSFKNLQQVTGEDGQARFKKMLCSLYRKEVAKNFSSRYIGELKLGIIGASQIDTLDRLFNVVSFHDYSILLNFCISNKIYPSVSLLGPHEISPVLGRQMADLVTTQFLEDCLDDGIVSEGLDNFSCLNFMVMYKGSASEFIPPWEKTSLYKNLDRFFNQNYSKTARELPSVTDYDDESSDRVMMAPLCTFTLRDVQKVVYFFHQGEKLLLDTFQAPPEVLSEIDTLSLNSEVKKQKISLDVDLTIYQKNNGVLLLWSSDEVRQKSEILREDIWQSIFEALNLKNMSIQDEDVISFWRSRYPRSGELEYDEIRRVHFYNPTGMEKEIVAVVPQDFYLIKTLDCVKGSLEKLASKLIIKIKAAGISQL